MATKHELNDIYQELSVLYDRLTDARDYEQNQHLTAEIDSSVVNIMDSLLFALETLNDDIDAGAYDEYEEDGDFERDDY